MSLGKNSRKIQQRAIANDKFYTPPNLAKYLITKVPLALGDIVLDPCKGKGAFYDNYPAFVKKEYCEIDEGIDFFRYDKKVDWCVSNPPFSLLDNWLRKTCEISRKGFAYILGMLNVVPNRILYANMCGFHMSYAEMFKIKNWYGKTFFVIFDKFAKKNCIAYNTIYWKKSTKLPEHHNFKSLLSF